LETALQPRSAVVISVSMGSNHIITPKSMIKQTFVG
jgi:hypothetical protein